eukprot:NODE_13_length_54415_cov_0.522424.p41 type:complete len:132 gc:universal NODE_13_length_54415_cov_0.522424:39207-39602(+)
MLSALPISTILSTLPGLIKAGSNFSIWLVVMNINRSSDAITPSKAFSNPEKVTADWNPSSEVRSTNAASTSSTNKIDLDGAFTSKYAKRSSVSPRSLRLITQMLYSRNPAKAWIKDDLPVPGVPYSKYPRR